MIIDELIQLLGDPTVATIDLSEYSFDRKDIESARAVAIQNRTLKTLTFNHKKLPDVGAQFICAVFAGNCSLEKLDFSYAEISGVAWFFNFLRNLPTTLKEIDLIGSRFSQEDEITFYRALEKRAVNLRLNLGQRVLSDPIKAVLDRIQSTNVHLQVIIEKPAPACGLSELLSPLPLTTSMRIFQQRQKSPVLPPQVPKLETDDDLSVREEEKIIPRVQALKQALTNAITDYIEGGNNVREHLESCRRGRCFFGWREFFEFHSDEGKNRAQTLLDDIESLDVFEEVIDCLKKLITEEGGNWNSGSLKTRIFFKLGSTFPCLEEIVKWNKKNALEALERISDVHGCQLFPRR